MDSGTIASPGLALADGPVPIAVDEGLWPFATVTRSYCLVVVATAEDDTSTSNDVAASGPISVIPPEVNYRVTSVSNTGGTVAGGPLDGSCTILNGGSDAGKQTVHWTAYLSADMVITVGVDRVIGAGEMAPLAANTSTVCTFSDTWPAAAGTWYFIVDVSADDDIESTNDVTVGPAVPIAAVDYLVVSVSNPSGTTAGATVNGNFTVLNNGSGVGASIVSWWVYASPGNTFYDAGDTIVASGSFPGLGSWGSFTPNYSGTWPSAPGPYYIVVSLVSADDASIPTAASSMVTLDPSPTPDYTVTTVAYPSGTTTSQAVNGTFTAQNASAANGSAVVDWYLYASLGNPTLDSGDTLLASGSFPGLASWGTITPPWSGSWPAEAGTYYVLVRLVTADDGSIAVAASPPVTVSDPPAPDYTVWFNSAMPWSGLVGAAMSATGTTEITIHNLSGNQGHAAITWTVYRSTDTVLDAGDTLVQQGTVAGLPGLGSTTAAFDGPWPGAPGGLIFLIASVHAADDAEPANDVVPAPHACAVGVYRYVEVEPNNGVGPAPSPAQTNNTGVSGLAANETIAIEGKMDAYDGYDTFRFVTAASMSRLGMRSAWATGYDDLDLYLWDTGSTELYSVSVGIDSEPGAGTFEVSGVTPRTCYVSANFWLANNTSGSTGKTYVIVVTGLP